jgi:prepilin-type processing-associated H-X9-DG protein
MNQTTRRFDTAFTLPGLASVVALTGLLGLFLAPLVVQLKSQQESNICLSNLRRIGQATLMYVQDYDQTMPLTTSNISGRWLSTFPHMVPADWSSLTTHPAVIGSKWVWPNTALQYGITVETLQCPSQEAYRYNVPRFTYSSSQAKPAAVGYTINGLLNAYPVSAITSLHKVPLIWEGRGRSGFLGGSWQNPVLNCPDAFSPCTYNTSCEGNRNGGTGFHGAVVGSIWTHGRTNAWLFADGHVEKRNLGAVLGKSTDYNIDPHAEYDERGVPRFAWTNGCHSWLFRPDY